MERISENIAKFFIETSDARFHSVIKFELHTVSYNPLRGETWIPLPKELADKDDKAEKKMIFGEKEKEQFDKETKCWICKEEFNDDKNVKVRDHCQFTGRYRGAAHNKCNLNYRKPNFTPVVFHNLSGYDSHLFIKNLGFSEGNIDCIPNNEERYISFTKRIQVGENKTLYHQIRFIDSFKFMAASLYNFVNNFPKDDFNNLKRHYTGDKLSLLVRKRDISLRIYGFDGKVKRNRATTERSVLF